MFGYPYCIDKLLKKPTVAAIRSYLSINGGAPTYINGSQGNISFANSNNVSWTFNNSTIVASVTFPGGAGGVAVSAGTESQSTGTIIFSNSNGITFGLNAGTITAAHNGITSQSNQAFSAQGGSSQFQTLEFNNANGITFSNNAGSVEASYTVPSTAGLISNLNFSAGTTSNNLTAITFGDANGITFGLNAGTITASHNALTSQSNQAASASNGSFTFQTLSFTDANNVTFGTSAGGIIFASVAAPGGGGSVNVSAGSTSNNLTQLVFANANNITFGMNGSTITATAGAPALSAGTTVGSFQTFRFLDSNGISFGMSSNEITASHNGLTSQSNQAVSAANGSFTFQTLSLANSNGISFSTGTQGIFASHDGLTSQSNQAASASNGSFTFQTLNFSNANNVTFGTSAGSIVTASVAAAGGGVTVSEYYPPWAFSQRATNSSLGQNTLFFQPFDVYQNISGSRINFYLSINQSISAGNSTGTCYGVFGYGLYTRNVSTLSLLTSYRLTVYSVSHSSNTQVNVTHYIGLSNATSHSTISTGLSTSNATTYLATRLNGQRVLALPLNLTLTPGRYWLGVANSTISGNAMTNALSVQGTSVGLQVAAVAFGTNSVASGGAWLRPLIGWGTLQTTSAGFPNTIAYTTNAIAATGNVTLVHFDIVGYTTGTNMI